MFKHPVLSTVALISAVLPVLVAAQTADTVYRNGKIYTVDDTRPWAEAVAIKDGKFLAVGSAEQIAKVTGETTEVIDLKGGFAMPGLHDSHAHPTLVYVYKEAGDLLFPESTPPDEIISLLKDYAAANPDKRILRASKWAASAFPGGKATKEWLDPHFPERAMYVIDETGHNAVVNSAALELAGITKDTPDPEFGTFERDPETGEPTGYISETAMMVFGKLVERPDADANYRALSRSLAQMRAYGITSLLDALVGPNAVEAYQQLEQDGKLAMRVDLAVNVNDFQAEATTEEESLSLLARRSEIDSPLIDLVAKFFADGTPLSKTSLMVEPYASDPLSFGTMTIGDKHFKQIKQMHRDGIQVVAHATTDGTTRKLLDVIEEARAEHGNPDLRHHIGHLLSVTKEDIPRFAELNVIAEFSPYWFWPTPIGELALVHLGPERYARWQAVKEFVDAGATVSVGSDWPAGTPDADPWKGLEGMVTRRDPQTNEGDTLGEPIDLETAIRLLTINGATAMMQEDVAGSIEVGKHADMILLNRNLFEIPATEISEVKVLKTIFAGKVVHSAD